MGSPDEFRAACSDQLLALVRQHGHKAAAIQEVHGASETYVRVDLPAADISLYVYADAAGLMVDKKWTMFELSDYPDASALCDAFLGTVKAALEAPYRASP